jgi:peptidoglycan/xylan/chitin deacetylase (PgdA/CDA1 family)
VREWFGERPVLVAVIALLAPVLVSVIGLSAAAFVPDVQLAKLPLPQFSLHLPDQRAGVPLPPPPPNPDQVVPAGRTEVHVPILVYHYIRINPDPRDRLGFNLSVTPPDFQAQMDWLKAGGYHAITLNDLRAYFEKQAPLPSRPVVLTFDDGYIDFFTTAFPVLMDHGFKAVSYVVPGFLNGPRYMSTDQVRAIDSAGIEIGAHTLHHVDLTKASAASLALELQGSRSALEQMVAHPVLDFCYPSGMYNATVIAATERAGFESATTEVPGTAHAWADRFTWTRVRVNGGERLDQFVASLGQSETTVTPSPSPGV